MIIKERRTETLEKVDGKMSNIQAATLIAKMHADLAARLRYENKIMDPAYSEATAVAIMALREE